MGKQSQYTNKNTPVDADRLTGLDSADSDKTKNFRMDKLRTYMQSRQPAPDPIVSDDTIDLTGVDGNTGTITGTNKINTILLEEGRPFEATFEDDLVLGHSASAVILPGSLDLKVKAGDTLLLAGGAGGVVNVDTTKQVDNRITDPQAVLGDDIVHAHRLTPETITVAGAGTPEADGNYTKRGTDGGKPFYNLEDSPTDVAAAIRWDGGSQWIIPAIGVSANGYVSSEDVATPDLVVTWGLGDGVNPVPTVTRTPSSNELIPTTVSKLGAYGEIVSVGANRTLTPEDTGKLFVLTTGGLTITLPLLADSEVGETRFSIYSESTFDLSCDSGERISYMYIDSGAVTGAASATISSISWGGVLEIRAVTATRWAIPGGPIK